MREFSSIGHGSIMLKTNMYDHFRDLTKMIVLDSESMH